MRGFFEVKLDLANMQQPFFIIKEQLFLTVVIKRFYFRCFFISNSNSGLLGLKSELLKISPVS